MNDAKLAILGGTPVRDIRHAPWPKWPRADASTQRAVLEVLDSSRWAVSGPYDGRTCFERRFARAFADFNEVDFCTPTSSGTAALTIALQAAGVGRGDEVLVPGLTWVACASAVVNLGAVPVLVDIDRHTLAMDPDRACAAITERTAAILVVHPYCSIADLDAFVSLAQRAGLPLIEDCAQAHGARWRGRPVGSFGLAGCYSMQQSKLLTSGEGGAVITSDPEMYERLEQLRADGRMFTAHPEAGRLELLEVAAVQGRNYCLSELQAAVLFDRIGQLDGENRTRAERAEYLREQLATVNGVSTPATDPRVTTRTYYNLVLRFDPDALAGNTIDAVCRALSAELGTMVNPVYTPLNRHRLLCPDKLPAGNMTAVERQRLDPAQYTLPEADDARSTCATITHPVFLEDKEGMDDIVTAIRKVQANVEQLAAIPQHASTNAF